MDPRFDTDDEAIRIKSGILGKNKTEKRPCPESYRRLSMLRSRSAMTRMIWMANFGVC
jgi:hypothetical protein